MTVTFCPSAPTVKPATSSPPVYVCNCTVPSEDPEVSLPAQITTFPPAPFPDAEPPFKFKEPAAAPALLPPSIVTACPAVLEVVAVGFIVGASVFVNLIPPFIFKLSANTAVGPDCPINTLPSLSTAIPSSDPSPEIQPLPLLVSIL